MAKASKEFSYERGEEIIALVLSKEEASYLYDVHNWVHGFPGSVDQETSESIWEALFELGIRGKSAKFLTSQNSVQ